MKIVLFPFARSMRNGDKHPKNYPYWNELIQLLVADGHELIQVGLVHEEKLVEDFRANLTLDQLTELIRSCDTWISVDSFGQHWCWHINVPGIAIFGQSDPLIFGHKENVNLLKDRSYLRDKQFWLWEQAESNDDAFVKPEVVIQALNLNFKK